MFRHHDRCKQGHCLANCRNACPCATGGSDTCGAEPANCMLVRKQLELMALDQQSGEGALAMALIRAPDPAQTQVATTSPFAFAITGFSPPQPLTNNQASSMSVSDATQAIRQHLTPEMKQNLQAMSPEDFKRGFGSALGL